MTVPAEVPTDAELPWSVLWTRGRGCAELAEILAGRPVDRVSGDLSEACISHRATLLVSRRMPSSFDLVSIAVPHDFALERVRHVTAAVGGGPHSVLAALTALRLGRALEVPTAAVSAFRSSEDEAAARVVLDAVSKAAPDLDLRPVEAGSAADLVAGLPPESLVVFGTPGGSLVRRRFRGPGARLRSAAPAGAVEVRRAPARAFQRSVTAPYVSPHLLASDARLLIRGQPVPVVFEGRLVGVLRPEALDGHDASTPVEDLMEQAVSVPETASLEDAREAQRGLDGAPLPVVDEEGRLVGCLQPEDLG